MKIAVIGSNMVDLISYVDKMPAAGETLEASGFSIGCGGKGANQAVAAAKLGAKVVMLSKVGDDMFADNTIQNLQSFGIDTQFVERVPGVSSGVAPIFVDKSAQNRILIIKGANQNLLPADIDRAAEKLKTCALIVLQLEISLETVYYAIDFANRHKIPALLNPAPATKSLDIAAACKCDFFVPNETELEILTDMPAKTPEDVERAARSLIARGLKNVVVTMGEKGSMWLSRDQTHRIPAVEVHAADTSGAGDAFIGCFADHFVRTTNILEAMRRASAYAALSVTKRGTQASYPDKARLERFLAERGNLSAV